MSIKKIFALMLTVLLSFSFISCSSKQNKEPNNTSRNTTSSKVENKIYKQGEEAFIIDDSGKQMYSLKINSVKIANDFEYKNDFPSSNQKQIVEVDYTYKNIAKDDEMKLSIHAADLQVVDSTGAVAEHSSMFPKQVPKEITVGTNCTVQGYYGLANKGDVVKIIFTSESYKKNSPITFEVPVK